MLLAYKEEQELELYAKNKAEVTFKKIARYSICQKSGQLGPKRKQGEDQVPEGFYHIDRFNPASFYHLSLGINYPNAADQKKVLLKT
jgi:murein L,D-transpeptidase YafK